RHTTTTADLIPLGFGGWVVDTPGVRQFQLYGTQAEGGEGLFADLRPFVPLWGFPDCTHPPGGRCAVKGGGARRPAGAGGVHELGGDVYGGGRVTFVRRMVPVRKDQFARRKE